MLYYSLFYWNILAFSFQTHQTLYIFFILYPLYIYFTSVYYYIHIILYYPSRLFSNLILFWESLLGMLLSRSMAILIFYSPLENFSSIYSLYCLKTWFWFTRYILNMYINTHYIESNSRPLENEHILRIYNYHLKQWAYISILMSYLSSCKLAKYVQKYLSLFFFLASCKDAPNYECGTFHNLLNTPWLLSPRGNPLLPNSSNAS